MLAAYNLHSHEVYKTDISDFPMVSIGDRPDYPKILRLENLRIVSSNFPSKIVSFSPK